MRFSIYIYIYIYVCVCVCVLIDLTNEPESDCLQYSFKDIVVQTVAFTVVKFEIFILRKKINTQGTDFEPAFFRRLRFAEFKA